MTEWFTLDIPKPPSVNRFMAKLGNKSPKVREWVALADSHLRAVGRYPRLVGPYELIVTFPVQEFGKYDPDNRIKPLSDWLQRVEIIQNDCMARDIRITWGDAPEGARVQVRAYQEALAS